MYNGDTRKENIILNNSEINSKKLFLESTPQYVTIGAHYHCNAKCVFCLKGDYPKFSLDIYRNFIEKNLAGVLSNAKHVGFCGMGEILLMPGINAFIDYLNDTLPYVGKVFTTNGIALKQNICDKLVDTKHMDDTDVDPYSILISLHTSKPSLHGFITLTDTFEGITSQINYLNKKRREKKTRVHIKLVFLVTSLNIDNLPEFVQFGEKMGVDEIACNYLTVYEPEQLQYSCYFCKEKTNEYFEKAREMVKNFNVKLILPPLFGSSEDKQNMCTDPWSFFYVETQGSVNPCCFAGNHIGYINKNEFSNIWNGEEYRRLREGMVSGNIHSWCRHCYRYNRKNVNDIRSHITFRPEAQKKILNYLAENKDKYKITKTEDLFIK